MQAFSPTHATAAIRERLGHPVIDSDGHLVEFRPVAMEYITRAGGAGIANRVAEEQRSTSLSRDWYGASEAERRRRWLRRPAFWTEPLRNHGLDLATVQFPDLLYRRLDQIGIDFAVLYPTMGINALMYGDAEVRRACCRGLNDYYADHWMSHPDRMTPVAAIPMHTPEEAVEELEYAVRTRGFKAVMLPSYVKRPIGAAVEAAPGLARYAWRADTFGIDSEYDYDPVWAACAALGVVPSFHGPGEGSTFHDSISNPVYNHAGHFAAAATAVCKSLFLGGVSRRFPGLRFVFLEGGVGWARSLLADLLSHWDKRSLAGLARDTDPRLADPALFAELYRAYGGGLWRPGAAEGLARRWEVVPGDPSDSFAALGGCTAEGLRELFAGRFFFGCEADDPVTASAFDAVGNPGGVRLGAVFGSDIGHWDVPLMEAVLEELYEPVAEGRFSPADLRDFVFANPVRLWASANPAFFAGTVVEQAAAAVLAGAPG
ncbi:MAG TPA: amidohydrolase family protein [Acidimicrobiales bacterium]|nr:amidohydrolase family protein [Acidimicrobiales bacterium]